MEVVSAQFYVDAVVHGHVYLEMACVQWWWTKPFIYPSNNREMVYNYRRIRHSFVSEA